MRRKASRAKLSKKYRSRLQRHRRPESKWVSICRMVIGNDSRARRLVARSFQVIEVRRLFVWHRKGNNQNDEGRTKRKKLNSASASHALGKLLRRKIRKRPLRDANSSH